MELYRKSAYELSQMMKNGEVSSVEITKSVFDRIKAVEPKIDAYVTLDEENALKAAQEIDNKRSAGEEDRKSVV